MPSLNCYKISACQIAAALAVGLFSLVAVVIVIPRTSCLKGALLP